MKPEQEAAYVEFVTARQAHLRRIAVAICGDWHTADDLLQTALTKLYVAWPRIRRQGTEEAYARQIIVRADIDRRRKPARREQPGDVPDTADGDAMARSDDRDALFAALQELPQMQRKVVVLRHWLGLSVAETAHELEIGEGTVKSHASRGLACLRTQLSCL